VLIIGAFEMEFYYFLLSLLSCIHLFSLPGFLSASTGSTLNRSLGYSNVLKPLNHDLEVLLIQHLIQFLKVWYIVSNFQYKNLKIESLSKLVLPMWNWLVNSFHTSLPNIKIIYTWHIYLHNTINALVVQICKSVIK
jgi:hypothetical protein